MSVHTLRVMAPPSTFTPEPERTEADVTVKNVRGDRLRPGDVLLRPTTDGNTVQASTVLRSVPSRLTASLTVVSLTYSPAIICPRDQTFTVLRPF